LELVHRAHPYSGAQLLPEAAHLEVERRHDQDVFQGHPPLAPLPADHVPPKQLLHGRDDRVALLLARLAAAVVAHRHPDDPGLRRHQHGVGAADHAVPFGLRYAAEPPLVDRLRDESANVGVHPAGAAQEHAELGRNGGAALEQVLQAGEPGLARVAPPGRLGELHLVTDENQVMG
jgi:hypothetical protein